MSYRYVATWALLIWPMHKATAAEATLLPIEQTCVDENATGYATFQSHNQKVVANSRGYFMTHIRTRNEAYTKQQWRLSQSTDGGKSWSTRYEAVNATSAPVLETGADDNLYLIRPDFVDGSSYFYRFRAADDYLQPPITPIPSSAAGKYSMALDSVRGQIYYFAHNNTFHTLGLDGAVKSSVNLLRRGDHAALQYPLLYLDAEGVLHAAWTTQRHGVYLYWDIHYLQSPDGGATWTTMAGQQLELPVIADHNGPADRISLDDEFDVHTWLESFVVRGGKVHFLYLAQTQPSRQHYVRYDLASAQREADVQPAFRGDTIGLANLDGFLATPADAADNRIFAVSRDAQENRLACLASHDNGATWHDYAVGPPMASMYAIGGCREVTSDGWIIGSFTEQVDATTDAGSTAKVHFFRIRVE